MNDSLRNQSQARRDGVHATQQSSPLAAESTKSRSMLMNRCWLTTLVAVVVLLPVVARAQDRLKSMPGYARYQMPLRGLYLAGSGAHPGGGVTGGPGANAARQILVDAKKQ